MFMGQVLRVESLSNQYAKRPEDILCYSSSSDKDFALLVVQMVIVFIIVAMQMMFSSTVSRMDNENVQVSITDFGCDSVHPIMSRSETDMLFVYEDVVHTCI